MWPPCGRTSSETRLKLGYSIDFADIGGFADILLVLGLVGKFGAACLPPVGDVGAVVAGDLVAAEVVVADVEVVRYLPFDDLPIASGLI